MELIIEEIKFQSSKLHKYGTYEYYKLVLENIKDLEEPLNQIIQTLNRFNFYMEEDKSYIKILKDFKEEIEKMKIKKSYYSKDTKYYFKKFDNLFNLPQELVILILEFIKVEDLN